MNQAPISKYIDEHLNNFDLESALLNIIYFDSGYLHMCEKEGVTEETFDRQVHKLTYRAMKKHGAGPAAMTIELLEHYLVSYGLEELDAYTVIKDVKDGFTPDTWIHEFIEELKILEYKRAIVTNSGIFVADIHKKQVDVKEVLEKMLAFANQKLGEMAGVVDVSYSDALKEMDKRITDLRSGGIPSICVTTGFADYNKALKGGWKPGLHLVAGPPHVGKTKLAQTLAEKAADNFQGVTIFSLEQPPDQLIERAVSGVMDVKLNDQSVVAALASLKEDDNSSALWQSYFQGLKELSGLEIRIVWIASATPADIRAVGTQHIIDYGTELFIVDYLQLMKANGRHKDRYTELTYIVNELKEMTGPKDFGRPILLLSQVTETDKAKTKTKREYKLRGSGDIEQTVDSVGIVTRPTYDDPKAESILIISHRKDRINETGGREVVLWYNKKTGRLEDATETIINLNKDPF